jgi:adenylosuccinate synthase
MEKIPVCVRYATKDGETEDFPFPTELAEAKPVLEYQEGWRTDISGCRTWEALPEAARRYVEYLETRIACPIRWVSVGPERDSIIVRS